MEKLFSNTYLPRPAVVRKIITENSQIKTFVLNFSDQAYNDSFSYQPGQFMMVSLPHCGEAPISFSSTPTRPGAIHLSVRKAGKLTGAMHALVEGAVIGLRGPYGRPFPMQNLKGKNLLFVAGGIGLAPLRSVINACLDQRNDYGTIAVLYGSRTMTDIAFKKDIDTWMQQPGVTCLLTVDEDEQGCWDGPVGVVTTLLDEIDIDPLSTIALVCGPPMMIRFVLSRLNNMGFADEDIITTMERHMKCGIGICRHCHMDDKLICVDGPVFNRAELKELNIMELQL